MPTIDERQFPLAMATPALFSFFVLKAKASGRNHCTDIMTSSSKLPFPLTVTQLYSRALWDPKQTTTLKSERQLAYALGYPADWRVSRIVTAKDGKSVIRDRIHAIFGKSKKRSQYTWFHHEAAQQAALLLEQEGTLNGSHLLPPMPLYTKGDVVEVSYDNKWYAASISKRKKQADLFLYSVVVRATISRITCLMMTQLRCSAFLLFRKYHEDGATQDEVAEEDIRPGEDPSTLAVELGFTADWKASRKGSRYILVSPTGERFTTKKAAMKFFNQEQAPPLEEDQDVGDPPWRTEGHDWIGRRVKWTSFHKVSGSRQVKVDQIGTIEGYIDRADVDKQGSPGFVSEATGEPADLFHVVFPEDKHHPYPSHCLSAQDLEEPEVEKSLLEESAAAKRKRMETLKGNKQAKR